MKKFITVAIVIVVAAVICGIFFLLGDKYGVEHMGVVNVSPTTLAQTMLQDEFYSTYREKTIVTTGKIVKISKASSGVIINFEDHSQYEARCQFRVGYKNLKVGERITVITEGASAQRQSTAVLLEDCYQVP